MIAEQKIAEIRQTARISEFISPFVSLKRAGRNLMGLCPFHTEQSPSFSVSDDGGFYHCFGCGAGGNVFKFVMQIENLSFPEAVRKVAARYGIEVPDDSGPPGAASERDATVALLSSAAKFYRSVLGTRGFGDTVRDYLSGRGIGAAACERFFLGAASPAGDALAQHLRRERLDLKLGERIGLIGLRGGSAYDRFRGRLMFPIRDPQGRTLGFGARRIGEGDGPKYLNSSDSPIYHKGRVLYGLFEWRESEKRPVQAPGAGSGGAVAAPVRSTELILVEGYLDVIAMSQAGITNAVAGCGTALTKDQAHLVRRHASDVVALFDGDDAGRRAAARSFPVFLEAGLWARGVFLPQSEDPDTFVRTHGAAALRSSIAAAKPLVEAYARYVSEGTSGAGATARVGAELAAVLRKIENPFEYDDFVKKASLWTGISERVLREQGKPEQKAAPRTPERRATLPSGPPGAEELLVSVLLSDAGCIDRLDERDILGRLHTEPWATIAADIFAARNSVSGYEPGDILAELDREVRDRIVSRHNGDPTYKDAAGREQMMSDCLGKLAAVEFERGKNRMLAEYRRLEETGDEAGASALLERWNKWKSSQSH